ncbi:MAG TPA: hybrid sensor histidine kinase/response regulator, partial [Elusimicrobia bacterium]|nr:hybrid sensor histidine kinase/response regulator [Elusimicrobiota bacterium]
LMTVVLGNSTDALSAIDQSSPIHVNISETIKAAESASSLVKQLLAFGRKQMLNIETLNVNTLLSNLSNMLQRVIGENIKLSFAFAPDISNVRIDAGQFQQVIINLAINARDAM